jgi:hypothetical protein
VRSTSNSNVRGSAKNRRARKAWLLKTFGDGVTAKCALNVSERCAGTVDFDTMTVDRYPIAGVDGGSYRRGNIQPACAACNFEDGGRKGQQQIAKAKELQEVS